MSKKEITSGYSISILFQLNVVSVCMDIVVALVFVLAILVIREYIVINVFQTQIANMEPVGTSHLNVIVMMDLKAYFVTNLFVEMDATLNM